MILKSRWVLAIASGPLTGPLILRAFAHAERRDWPMVLAYAVAVPCVWLSLAAIAAKVAWLG